jgi:hypothetical protein
VCSIPLTAATKQDEQYVCSIQQTGHPALEACTWARSSLRSLPRQNTTSSTCAQFCSIPLTAATKKDEQYVCSIQQTGHPALEPCTWARSSLRSLPRQNKTSSTCAQFRSIPLTAATNKTSSTCAQFNKLAIRPLNLYTTKACLAGARTTQTKDEVVV